MFGLIIRELHKEEVDAEMTSRDSYAVHEASVSLARRLLHADIISYRSRLVCKAKLKAGLYFVAICERIFRSQSSPELPERMNEDMSEVCFFKNKALLIEP
jgi:hypothetical protein